jgi:hypothetical protein
MGGDYAPKFQEKKLSLSLHQRRERSPLPSFSQQSIGGCLLLRVHVPYACPCSMLLPAAVVVSGVGDQCIVNHRVLQSFV